MDDMDVAERIAYDLERAQEKRFRKAKENYSFFDDPVELAIFEHIRTMRKSSSTYHPLNLR